MLPPLWCVIVATPMSRGAPVLGCSPNNVAVHQILFLHLPKSGGTAVGSWLRANAEHMRSLGPVGAPGGNFFECQCAPLQRAARGLPFFNFSAPGEGGSILEGHWDASVEDELHAFASIEWATTAVVVSTRAPLQRATSLYHYFRVAGSRQYANDTLRGYLARPELDNPLARTLAGAGVNGAPCGCADICRAGTGEACQRTRRASLGTDGVSGGGALLQPAISFLEQRTCAVFVAERPLESAAYLAHALGIAPGSKLTPIRNENTFTSMAAKVRDGGLVSSSVHCPTPSHCYAPCSATQRRPCPGLPTDGPFLQTSQGRLRSATLRTLRYTLSRGASLTNN